MRFLFECVTCCTMINPSSSSNDEEEPTSPPTPRTEETRSLVNRRRKRAPTRSSSADWKPSLFPISEESAVSVTLQKPVNRKPASPRTSKRCGSSSVEVNARSRSYDNFGREPLPMVFPAFSAAPFMF
ncbi:uncharacterized protein LOC110684317 [Chenopodium quinoa]|uniref:uncharacterized protein LOC110684317 n=1 Tax=Chenopodium quinoa TaxID=63459 RepID=UPI000B79A3C6|nr:uncharacterized protein LOC110684317 [Chenopodium quinoa]